MSVRATIQALLRQQFLDYAVHISRKHRFLYVVNPKVGCSSILWTLQRLESGDKDSFPPKVGAIHDRESSPLLRPSDIGASGEILCDEAYFKFTFVRNPLDRLLSCFLNKIARPTVQRTIVLRLLGRASHYDGPISLTEFVSAIARQSPEEMDPHWRPQWAQTLQDVADFDAIGRFEQFDHDLKHIGEQIHPQFQGYVYSEKRQATGAKPYHLISPEAAGIIRELYDRDFVLFNYPSEYPS